MNDDINFLRKLREAEVLINQEKYKEALLVLEKLKILEKGGNFDYSLTHKLYQLISNTISLYNQHIILNALKEISRDKKASTFQDLLEYLNGSSEIDIDGPTLRKEVELLVLRNIASYKIDGNKIIF